MNNIISESNYNKHHHHHHDHDKDCEIDPITGGCCNAVTGCDWDGTLRKVKTEPIYVQKVYDAILVNLQAISTVSNFRLTPNIGRNSRIVAVRDIRCKKYFNPNNISDPKNLVVTPETVLSGADFVKKANGDIVEVVGPDGVKSERIIYADTTECDGEELGTPIFGTQKLKISGNVIVEIDAVIIDSNSRRRNILLTGNVPIGTCQQPLILTNFFELCLPSVQDSAFFPRFTEFCNILCETRLATNSITRDITVDAEGNVEADLIIALCVNCEKKIIVPVQLCVLSTGFPELSPITSPICTTFPSLFPRQIDENSVTNPIRERLRPQMSIEDEI